MAQTNSLYELKKISDNDWLINEKLSTMFVLCGSERALVIDCGTGVGDFKSVIESITKGLPYDIAMTHSHVDHIGGRGQFSDVFVSSTDAKFIKEVTTAYRRFYTFFNAITGNIVRGVHIKPVKAEPTVHTIKEGDVFSLGDRHIKVIETPGHTVGSVSFLDIESRTIYIGDVANEFLFMWLPHCTSIDKMNLTIKKILNIDGYDTVWASHHTEPFKKERLNDFLNCGLRLAKKKNSYISLVRVQNTNGDKIIYKSNRIH